MKPLLRNFLVSLLVLLGTANYCSAQEDAPKNSIYDFMQQNADSTLVLRFDRNWLGSTSLMLLSKKGNTISIYTYHSTFENYIVVPRRIADTLRKLENYPEVMKEGINRFFSAKYIESGQALSFWNAILKLKPWQIKDDKHEGGEGCPLDPNNINSQTKLFDGGSVVLDLITKDKIRRLKFYAPEFYEQKNMCPGRKARMNILEIEKVFFSYFGRW